MGFLDALKGTKRPREGVEPCPLAEVREAVTRVAGPDNPFVVGDGSAEGADLIAEWKIDEPLWQVQFKTKKVDRVVKILMKFDPSEHAVRTVDKQYKVTWTQDGPTLSVDEEYTRGNTKSFSFQATVSTGDDGRPELEKTFSFSSDELKKPLQQAVLDHGWTWQGVPFGKL